MRRLLFILLLLCVDPATAQDRSFSVALGGQVITGDDIREAGVTRLSNIFVLFDGVRFTTVDGFTTAPSFNGLAALQERVWHVEIDGQPVDDGVLDVQSLNTLGVPVTAIDSIVVIDVPHIRRGRLERGGVIEIWTRAGSPDGFVRSVVSAGNETGDPGPYRYADPSRNSGNVDKEGPDVAVEGGIAQGGVSMHAGLSMNQIIPSDPAVFRRNTDAFDASQTPVMRVLAPFVSLHSRLPSGDLRVRMSGVTFDDMLFTRNVGREVPADHKRAGVTAILSTRGSFAAWQATAGASQQIVRNEASASRIPFHWDERNASVALSGRKQIESGEFEAGMAVDYVGARSELGLWQRKEVVTRRIHLGYSRMFGKTLATTTVFGAFDGTAGGGGITLAAGGSPWMGQRLDASVSFAQTLPSESNPLAYWVYRGLNLSPTAKVSYAGRELEPQLASADIRWSWHPTQHHALEVSAIGRRFSGLRLSNRTIVPDGNGFAVSSLAYDAAWGTTIGVRARGELRYGRSTYTVAYSYQTVLDGNALFYDAFETISRRQLRASAVHRVADRFSISNTLYHYSGSRWSEFEAIEDSSSYSSRVPGFVRWDIAFYKGLAGDLLQLSFVFENVLNDRVGYHPIGATFDRALRVQLAVILD